MTSSVQLLTRNQISTSHSLVEPTSSIICIKISKYVNQICSWILVSGANDHVCSSLFIFSLYYKIIPAKINLPNDNYVIVNYDGNIRFSPILNLTNILFSPNFHLNLIYISKMCQTLNCCTIFSIGNCILQELNIKRMIYLSSRVKGLHRLQIYEPHLASQVKSQNLAFQTTSQNLATKANTYNTTNLIIKNNTNNFVIPKYSIWYFRLVHVSHNRIRQMSQM